MNRLAIALLALAAACKRTPPDTSGYIDAIFPIRSYLNEADFIADATVESLEAVPRAALLRVDAVRKGSRRPHRLRFVLAPGTGFRKEESDLVHRQLVPGSRVVVFSAGNAMQLYAARTFLSAYGGWNDGEEPSEWEFAHIENHGNRTFHGSVDELSALVPEALAGRAPCPPPDPRRPRIDMDSFGKLPLPGEPVDPEYLPPPFRPTRPPPPPLRQPEDPLDVDPGLRFVADGDGLRFQGFLEVPADGTYFLFLSTAAPAQLKFGDDLLIAHEGGSEPFERGADVALRAGRHAVVITTSAGTPPRVLWSGPDVAQRPVPGEAWSRRK